MVVPHYCRPWRWLVPLLRISSLRFGTSGSLPERHKAGWMSSLNWASCTVFGFSVLVGGWVTTNLLPALIIILFHALACRWVAGHALIPQGLGGEPYSDTWASLWVSGPAFLITWHDSDSTMDSQHHSWLLGGSTIAITNVFTVQQQVSELPNSLLRYWNDLRMSHLPFICFQSSV